MSPEQRLIALTIRRADLNIKRQVYVYGFLNIIIEPTISSMPIINTALLDLGYVFMRKAKVGGHLESWYTKHDWTVNVKEHTGSLIVRSYREDGTDIPKEVRDLPL